MPRAQVLSLYKRLLRNADNFVYTCKEYFRNRVREEFSKNKGVSEERSLKLIQVCFQIYLTYRLVLLINCFFYRNLILKFIFLER